MLEFANRKIEAVIFDMDGTMFDTERLRFDTIRRASNEIAGRPIGDHTLIGSLGLSAARAEALARDHNGADYPYAAIRKRADELELAHVRAHGVPVKPGLLAVLERLRRAGLSLAVATSSRRAIAEEYLINANVLKYFDITVCGDEVAHGKPHPDIFQRAAASLGCAPEDCLMIEDSENGLLSASRAGGLPIHVHDIKAPPRAVRALALRSYPDGMTGFLDELRRSGAPLPTPRLTEPFPATLNDAVAGIHGFGAMGGGLLAQVFSHWDGYTRPREIIGVTGDAGLRDLVNALGRYTVRYGVQAFDQTISNVRLIDTADEGGITDMYARAAIVGLAMPEPAIRQQAPVIARALLARHAAGGGDLVILPVLNKVGGSDFVRGCLTDALNDMAPDQADAVLARTHIPETVVNRIVSRLGREALLRQARIKLEIFDKAARAAATDSAEVAGGLPTSLARSVQRMGRAADMARALERLNLVLYHAEPDMQIHAGRGAPILERLRQITCVDDIHVVQMVKNRLWNGTHAILAWYAHLLGHATIGQGMSDHRVAALVEQLLKAEIRPALLAEYPQAAQVLPAFTQTFVARCRRSFKDPCLRVGRDPLRKLNRHERVLGTIAMAHRHGIATDALEFGVALGVMFALHPDQAEARESQAIRQVFARRGLIEDVLCWQGPWNGQPWAGLDPVEDAPLLSRIAAHFARLRAGQTALPDPAPRPAEAAGG